MNILPLLLLYGAGRRAGAAAPKGRAPSWPSARRQWPAAAVRRRVAAKKRAAIPGMPKIPAIPKAPPVPSHPSARRKLKRRHTLAHSAHHVPPAARMHVSPAAQSYRDAAVRLATMSPVEPAPPHTHATPAAAHVERHQPKTKFRPGPGDIRVAAAQRILVALGWRGDETTHGSVSPSLTDGLYGPVSRHNWQRSARKRQLDTTFARLGPKWVHVHPATYKALLAVARSKGLV